MRKQIKKMLVNALCAALVLSAMAFIMTGCGNRQRDNGNEANDAEEAFSGLHSEDDWEDEDDRQTDGDEDDDSSEESVGAGDFCDIVIGSGTFIIDIPSDAENVYVGPYLLSYDQGSINVEYSDSFCELTDDAIEYLTDIYDIWSDQSDTLSTIEPVETQVGEYDAYYCRAVDSTDFVCYIFFVDIGEENYMNVTLLGSADELSEEKAFELADVDFR